MLKFSSPIEIGKGESLTLLVQANSDLGSVPYLCFDKDYGNCSLSSFRVNGVEQFSTQVWLSIFYKPKRPIRIDPITKGSEIMITVLNNTGEKTTISGKITNSYSEAQNANT